MFDFPSFSKGANAVTTNKAVITHKYVQKQRLYTAFQVNWLIFLISNSSFVNYSSFVFDTSEEVQVGVRRLKDILREPLWIRQSVSGEFITIFRQFWLAFLAWSKRWVSAPSWIDSNMLIRQYPSEIILYAFVPDAVRRTFLLRTWHIFSIDQQWTLLAYFCCS